MTLVTIFAGLALYLCLGGTLLLCSRWPYRLARFNCVAIVPLVVCKVHIFTDMTSIHLSLITCTHLNAVDYAIL